jgi:hypothetical protein
MKLSTILTTTLATTTLAQPLFKCQSASIMKALSDIITRATKIAPAGIYGDSQDIANSIDQINKGAISFHDRLVPGLKNFIGGRTVVVEEKGQSTFASAFTKWVKDIATLSHKLLREDEEGAKEAIGQMTKGATEFADGLRSGI